MRPGANKQDSFIGHIVNQKPVRFYMAFPEVLVLSREFVRTTLDWNSTIISQQPNDIEKFFAILTVPYHPFQISLTSLLPDNVAHVQRERTRFSNPSNVLNETRFLR